MGCWCSRSWWPGSWWAASVIGLFLYLTPVRLCGEPSTSLDFLRTLEGDLTQIEQGLNMIEWPLSMIGQNLLARETRLNETEKTLAGREQELNMREKDLNEREVTYGALLVEVQTLKTDLEASHVRAMQYLAWGVVGGIVVGGLVAGFVVGM